MRKWLVGLGGILLVMALSILGRDGRQLRRTEAKRDEAMTGDIAANLGKASALSKKAEKQKANAAAAIEATKVRLEKISAKDSDMDDLLSAWQSERVRQQSG